MTDAARNHEDSAGDRHGRSAVPAQVSAAPAQESVPARARRRWFQCSLRTMLVGTTLIAFGLALFVNKVDRARRAVAAIEALGGTCAYRNRDTKPGQMEAWLRRYLPRNYFDEVITVDAACNAKFTDVVVAHLSALTSLKSLNLSKTRVTDAGLAHLSALTSLELLYLGETQVTDAGLAHLSALTSLELLYLGETQVTNAGLEHLSALTSLKWLGLSETRVTDAGLEHLSALTSLKVLALGRTQVTDDGLAHLSSLRSLKRLYLSGTHVTDAGLEYLLTLTSVDYCVLMGMQVTRSVEVPGPPLRISLGKLCFPIDYWSY